MADDLELTPAHMQELNRARQTRALLEILLERRQKVLITRLVSDYRGGKHSHDRALGAIAEISGMMEQIDDCTRVLKGD